MDSASYLLEKGVTFSGSGTALYHAPCHDSLGGKALDTLKKLGGFDTIKPVPHCCSEAGTLALSRPDITDAMLHRKRDAIREVLGDKKSERMLTNCPSCVQGLGRNLDLGIEPQHIIVALAEKLSGTGWKAQLEISAQRATAVSF